MAKTKYKRGISFVLLLSLFLLSSCARPKAPEVKHNDCELWNIELEGANPDFVEDYIYMWDLLENEYPTLAAAERITGKNAEEIKERYYYQIPKCELPGEFYKYVVGPCLAQFGEAGHLSVIPSRFYSHIYEIYSGDMEYTRNNPRSQYNYSQLTMPSTLLFYAEAVELAEQKMEKADSEGESGSIFSQQSKVDSNLDFYYYPENSAGYVNINSMNYYPYSEINNNPEYYALEEFFKKLEAEGYENCIIDIRNNPGGADLYWTDMIIAPNIAEPHQSKTNFLITGDLSRYYTGNLSGYKLLPISEFPLDECPALNQGDLEPAKHFTTIVTQLDPSGDAPWFTGRFWLLVGKACYSSSETFLQFAQQSGFATLVGENTGGDGGGIDPMLISLPNTGILFRFSVMLGLNPDGSCNEELGTTPDYLISDGEDALEKCLDLISADK